MTCSEHGRFRTIAVVDVRDLKCSRSNSPTPSGNRNETIVL